MSDSHGGRSIEASDPDKDPAALKSMQEECDLFNSQYPVGSDVMIKYSVYPAFRQTIIAPGATILGNFSPWTGRPEAARAAIAIEEGSSLSHPLANVIGPAPDLTTEVLLGEWNELVDGSMGSPDAQIEELRTRGARLAKRLLEIEQELKAYREEANADSAKTATSSVKHSPEFPRSTRWKRPAP